MPASQDRGPDRRGTESDRDPCDCDRRARELNGSGQVDADQAPASVQGDEDPDQDRSHSKPPRQGSELADGSSPPVDHGQQGR
jgi:hypothetical protein